MANFTLFSLELHSLKISSSFDWPSCEEPNLASLDPQVFYTMCFVSRTDSLSETLYQIAFKKYCLYINVKNVNHVLKLIPFSWTMEVEKETSIFTKDNQSKMKKTGPSVLPAGSYMFTRKKSKKKSSKTFDKNFNLTNSKWLKIWQSFC